jgi:acyl-CoA thioesterase
VSRAEHLDDIELIGLEVDPDLLESRFELIPRLTRMDGALYGGTAIAASIVAMEIASARDTLWITTQYVSVARVGSRIECSTDILATGRSVSQLRVTGQVDGQIIFTSVGSTAIGREGGLEGQYHAMPLITGPEDSSAMAHGLADEQGRLMGFGASVEFREAQVQGDELSPPSMALWARFVGGRPMTGAGIAFVADMVPPAIARSGGMFGGGTSLDNSLRFGRIPRDLEWVLLDLRGDLAAGGLGHGTVRVWTPTGDLVATGGQSSNMYFTVSPEEFAQLNERRKQAPPGEDLRAALITLRRDAREMEAQGDASKE